MAVGDVTCNSNGSNAFKVICLLSAASATNGQPSAATDGVQMYPSMTGTASATGAAFQSRCPLESTIIIKGSGTGTVNALFRLWGYSAAAGVWVPVGATPAGDTVKGELNAGVAIGETKADTILHSEPVLLIGHFDRVYLEIVSTSGSSLSISAYMVTAHRRAF